MSPFCGQAVPAETLPDPEQMAPRESESVYVASLQTETSVSAETAVTANAATRSVLLMIFIVAQNLIC